MGAGRLGGKEAGPKDHDLYLIGHIFAMHKHAKAESIIEAFRCAQGTLNRFQTAWGIALGPAQGQSPDLATAHGMARPEPGCYTFTLALPQFDLSSLECALVGA